MTAWAVGSFGLLDSVMGPHDHRLPDDSDRGIGALTALHRRPRLGQCLVHEELVVHAAMLADGLRPSVTRRARPTPNRNRSTRAGSGSMTPA